jgi:ABC-type transport system substrate-binding protein
MKYFVIIGVAIAALAVCISCSNKDPMSPYNPEIANNPEDFQFQITGASNLDRTQDYVWRNPANGASINQACAISGGTATLSLIDSTGAAVYTRNLAENGTYQSTDGFAGPWTIRVHFTNLDGTVNFRVQRR